MTFQVFWTPRAEQQLAALWLITPQRDAVTLAAANIDTRLRVDPLDVGESREKNFRIVFEPPLAILCDVREDDRRVVVFDVVELDRH